MADFSLPDRRNDPGWASTRASDADREKVMAQLQEHYAEGRLDYDEWSVRMEQVSASKTLGELDRVLFDLPAPVTQPPPAPGHQRVRKTSLQDRFGLSTAQLIMLAIAALIVVPIVLRILQGLAPVLIVVLVIWLLVNRHRMRRF